MFKLIFLLLIVSQINCDEDTQTINNDEIDITTIAIDKQKPEINSDDKDILKGGIEDVLNKDNIDEKSGPKLEDKSEPKVENKFEPKVEEKIEPEVDSGKDEEKKTVSDTEEQNKDVTKDGDNKVFISDDKEFDVNKEVVKTDDKEVVKTDDKEVVKSDDKDVNKGEVINGNEIMDSLLALMTKDYGKEFDKISVPDFGPVKHGRWGTSILHSGVISGLSNVHRVGDILIKKLDHDKKHILGDIAVTDVKADFKVDAKLFHRISIKNRTLHLWLKKALLNVLLEVDLTDKKLIISQISVKSIEGFGVKSGRLFWPFNKLADSIIKSQEDIIKSIIKAELTKYMGKVALNHKFEEVFAQLF